MSENESTVNVDIRSVALELMRLANEDKIAHLQLRMIRDNQAPRFESLRVSHPEIYEEFLEARNGPHEVLLKNRETLVEILTHIIEGNDDDLERFVDEGV